MNCIGIEGNSVSFLVGGEAGQGITRSGSLLGKAIMRGGFHVFGANDYPSVIRGSHNFYVLRASDEEVHSHSDRIDLLLALNKEGDAVALDAYAVQAEGPLKPRDRYCLEGAGGLGLAVASEFVDLDEVLDVPLIGVDRLSVLQLGFAVLVG